MKKVLATYPATTQTQIRRLWCLEILHTSAREHVTTFSPDQVRKLCSSSHSLSYDRHIASSKTSCQRGQSRASTFKIQYLLVSLRSFNSCLRLLPPFPVPFFSPSLACFRRQFLRKDVNSPVSLSPFYFMMCVPFLLQGRRMSYAKLYFVLSKYAVHQASAWYEVLVLSSCRI